MKPVRLEFERALRHAARVAGPQLARLADQAQLGKRRTQICTRLGDQLKLVPVENIFYFEADQKYVVAASRRQRHHRRLAASRSRTSSRRTSCGSTEIQFVALRHIRAVERGIDGRYLVRFKECDDALPVSRRHATEALRQIRGGQ
jgi:two-component system response regulator AlgR